MDTDCNLLFGVLALQADLIDSTQFIEACTLWTTRKNDHLADVLVDRGWLLPSDREHVDYLVERRMQKTGGDAKVGLASLTDDVKRLLATIGDPSINQSLSRSAPANCLVQNATVDYSPGSEDRYALIRLHATGGIGRVWLARDSVLGRDIALKELRPERSNDARLRARFFEGSSNHRPTGTSRNRTCVRGWA